MKTVIEKVFLKLKSNIVKILCYPIIIGSLKQKIVSNEIFLNSRPFSSHS